MADDKKSNRSQASSPASPAPAEIVDDWDSLPLDPSDDWDDIPPPKTDFAPHPESTSLPIPAEPIPPAADPPSFPEPPSGAVPPPDSGQIASLLGAEDEFQVDDFGDQLLNADLNLDEPESPADEFDLPASPGAADFLSPDGGSTEPPIDGLNFDESLSAAREAGIESTEGGERLPVPGPGEPSDQDYSDPEADSSLPSSDFDSDDFPKPWAGSEASPASGPDALSPHLGLPPSEGESEVADETTNSQDSALIMDKIEAELEDLPTQKVELDIEGIFLEDHDPPAAEAATPEPEPQPQEDPSLPEAPPAVFEEAPAPKKIPKIKLLMLLVPALLLVCGLGFGLYKLFSSPSEKGGPSPLAIDPAVPPRDPQPGALDLGAFYVNFPGERGETIMEMTVVLHYKDLPDRAAVETRLPMVRDIIYLVTQGQGSQVISNGEAQRLLRQTAAEQVNAALGGNHIDYVQINQIRILQ